MCNNNVGVFFKWLQFKVTQCRGASNARKKIGVRSCFIQHVLWLGGEGVSGLLMRFADGFELRGIVNSRNDREMIQKELERLGTWTGNQMIQAVVSKPIWHVRPNKKKYRYTTRETDMENSHLEGGWGWHQRRTRKGGGKNQRWLNACCVPCTRIWYFLCWFLSSTPASLFCMSLCAPVPQCSSP